MTNHQHEEQTRRGTPAMSGPHDLLGAYALGALDELERARFTSHVRRCRLCRAELSAFEETSSALDDPGL